MKSDFKQEPRIRDVNLMRRLHREWRECALCGGTHRLSLHHVLKHPRDDVRGNLVMTCGSGTSGCHGELEAHRRPACEALGLHIVWDRPDIVEHLTWRLRGREEADAWLRRYLYISLQ